MNPTPFILEGEGHFCANYPEGAGTCLSPQRYLLNDLAAQGDVGATEDIGHVPGYFQIILPIHTWNLGGGEKQDHHSWNQLPSPCFTQSFA